MCTAGSNDGDMVASTAGCFTSITICRQLNVGAKLIQL
jgi:hypothetical protein